MYSLYYYPDNASTFPHMLLRELGVPFELRLVDRKQDAQRSAEYLRLNPQGLIPVLVDGELVTDRDARVSRDVHLVDRFSWGWRCCWGMWNGRSLNRLDDAPDEHGVAGATPSGPIDIGMWATRAQ